MQRSKQQSLGLEGMEKEMCLDGSEISESCADHVTVHLYPFLLAYSTFSTHNSLARPPGGCRDWPGQLPIRCQEAPQGWSHVSAWAYGISARASC